MRDSIILAAGRKWEMGRYEVHMEVSLPCVGIGMVTNDSKQPESDMS